MTGNLFLVGMMGAGKTTVSELLGKRLGRPVLDSDAEVERTTGRSVVQILATDGEPAFRAEERRVLAQAVGSATPAVVAVAGGAVLDPRNRALLRSAGGTVVWLRASLATLGVRVGDGSGRPLLGDDPPAALARLMAQREPLYAEVADFVVDVDDASPEQVADEVLADLSGTGRGAS